MATLKEQIAALQKGWSAEIANQEQPGIQTDIKTGSLSFDNKNWMVFQYPGGGVTVLRRSPNQAGLGANSYRAEILDPETGKIEETVVSPSRIADIGGKVLLATMAVLAANPQLAASLGGAEAAAAAAGELAGADLAIALGEGIQPIASTAAQAGAVGSNLASLGAGIGLAGTAPGLLSTIGGALSAVSLTKSGAGTLSLSSATAVTGTATVSGGTVSGFSGSGIDVYQPAAPVVISGTEVSGNDVGISADAAASVSIAPSVSVHDNVENITP